MPVTAGEAAEYPIFSFKPLTPNNPPKKNHSTTEPDLMDRLERDPQRAPSSVLLSSRMACRRDQ